MKLLIITLPALTGATILFFGRFLGTNGSKILASISILTSMIISIKLIEETLKGKTYIINIKEWFNIGITKVNYETIYDQNTILMCVLISTITFIVITFSNWYLSDDPFLNRFLAFLLLFSVAMFILVSANNLLLIFLGWESVGIISYLLINNWFNSYNNNKSSLKAFLFNKLGDIFFLFSLFIFSFLFGSFSLFHLNFPIYQYPLDIGIESIEEDKLFTIFLFSITIAAMVKSSQILFHCWLGDAMAGPTPVSALLHAATMVTAGIFLLLRIFSYLDNIPQSLQYLILIVGSLTILFGGISAIFQYDIKKVIAFSTCSQLGYMFFSLGLTSSNDFSLFHLLSHGFFKALLFLSAGILIHSFLNEQDLRKFGNLLPNFPLLYFFFLIGSLSLMGLPSLSGFFSKDLILLHSSSFNSFFFPFCLFVGSISSSFYSFKILFYLFFNSSPNINTMTIKSNLSLYFIPLFILVLGSIFFSFLTQDFFIKNNILNFDLEFFSFFSKFFPSLIPFISLLLFLSIKYDPFVSSTLHTLYRVFSILFNRRFFFDTFINFFFIFPSLQFSYHLSYKFLDKGILELLGPLGFFRLFFYFPKHFSLNNQLLINSSFLFFYFFSSFLLFIPFLVLY